jgi:hypothetical protein
VVIQPERSTSATPAMVASSMLGRVKGRKSLFMSATIKMPTMMTPIPAKRSGVTCSPSR